MDLLLDPVRRVGRFTLEQLRALAETFALLYGALVILGYTRTRGLRVTFSVAVSQTLFTGVHALPLVSLAALAMGTLIITQATTWLPVEYVATVTTAIIMRNAIPLVVALILLGRSGTAICVELGGMKLSGEIDGLIAMGVPLEQVIVLPRLIAGVLSAVVLTVYALAVALAAGFAASEAISSLPFGLDALVRAVNATDVIEPFFKALVFGAAIVLVSIREGLSVRASSREIPQATTRAVVRSMAIVFVLNTLISIAL